MNADNPGYYAVIPANVRYDKRLKPNAKLLFGEITCLTNKKGFCWAVPQLVLIFYWNSFDAFFQATI